MTISVIIICYNCEKYLGKAIESVLHQSYQDFELLIVDDGSNDGSLQIANAYSSKNPKIKIIKSPHRGVAGARNRGLDEACGDYIFFLDADDTISNSCLYELVSVAKKENTDIAITNYEFIFSDERRNNRKYSSSVLVADGLDFWDPILNKYHCFYTWGKLIKKSVFDNLRLQEGLAYVEDLELLPRLCQSAMHNAFINKPLYQYYIRDVGETQNNIFRSEIFGVVNKVTSSCNGKKEFESFFYAFFVAHITRWLVVEYYLRGRISESIICQYKKFLLQITLNNSYISVIRKILYFVVRFFPTNVIASLSLLYKILLKLGVLKERFR